MNAKKLKNFKKDEDEYDWALICVLVALALETLAVSCELLHQWMYLYNGYGNSVFNFSAQMFQVLASFTITLLLILISWGWTIDFMKFEDFDIFLPLIILIAVVHIMIVGKGISPGVMLIC